MNMDIISIILGGGKGERLYPLTKYRAKPAVPIAGKFRLIDIPVSNCIHSGVNRMFVLTQFNSRSLNRHIFQTYRFDAFSRGYIQILEAHQTAESMDWYLGTADAVRRNLHRFVETPCKYMLILAGDHLYRMNYQNMIREHVERGADITIAVLPVEHDQVKEFGILKTDPDGRIVKFIEKPCGENEICSVESHNAIFKRPGIQNLERSYMASMGIYIFNKDTMIECLADDSMADFGKQVIPALIGTRKVYAYFFDGYWRDVGTIKSFYEANMELTDLVPRFDFYDESAQIFTQAMFLPGSKVNSCVLESSILCEGSIITECEIRKSIVGPRSIARSGTKIHNSIMMGANYYETLEEQRVNDRKGLPLIGVGSNCFIENAIIDNDSRIGHNVRIVNAEGKTHYDGENYSIRDNIVVIHKRAVIPDNTVI